jgi:hypothetical protein
MIICLSFGFSLIIVGAFYGVFSGYLFRLEADGTFFTTSEAEPSFFI